MKQRKWEEASQGPDEADGNPAHLLRHSHGKRGTAGRQDRSIPGGLLKRKYAHRKVLFKGELRLCHGELTNNPAETTGMRNKNVNLMDRKQKRMRPIGCFGQIENIRRQSLKYIGYGRMVS